MGWTSPKTWTNTHVRRGELNTHLRDNLLALKYPAFGLYDIIESSDYSTTNTSFADLDATEGKFLHTIDVIGDGNGGNGDVFVCLNATVYSSTTIRIYFRVLLDGVAQNADDGLMFTGTFSGMRCASFLFPIRNVAPGSRAFKLQWKVSGGTGVLLARAGTSTRDLAGQFWVREMS